jgi:sulfur carrier protein ThiS adenylyltransferase
MAKLFMTQTLSNKQLTQYYRQVLLPQVEESGQHQLLQQHVLIIGVGGLGTHVAQQLSAAGIGHLHLMDDDRIEISNLPRQILFAHYDVGKTKVECAKAQLIKQNYTVNVSTYNQKFTNENIKKIAEPGSPIHQAMLAQKIIVLDCSDNMLTRQAVNLWCVQQGIPLVSAAVTSFDGQLLLIDNQTAADAGCYHCIYTPKEVAQNCANMGVLGPTVATVASMQALMAIKQILKISPPDNKLHIFQGLTLSWQQITRQKDPTCSVCQNSHSSTFTQQEGTLC